MLLIDFKDFDIVPNLLQNECCRFASFFFNDDLKCHEILAEDSNLRIREGFSNLG